MVTEMWGATIHLRKCAILFHLSREGSSTVWQEESNALSRGDLSTTRDVTVVLSAVAVLCHV